MYRFLLTPRWWGINLFVVLAIPFCIYMGSWQLGRFEDRVDSHRSAETAPDPAKQAAQPLERLLPVTTETSGKLAEVRGRYAEQFLVPGRTLDDRQGYYVLAMLKTAGAGGDGGKALPVVRGWAAGDARGAAPPPAPTGEVTVTGALQASENAQTDGVNTAGGLPAGQVGMISSATLVNLVPYEVHDAWITQSAGGEGTGSGAPGGLKPVPAVAPQGSGLDLKAFQNLGYTGEWFVFAGFVLFMWFRLVRREVEALRDLELGIQSEDAAADTESAEAAGTGGAVEAAGAEAGVRGK
ncbi:SURF1 family protein [Streptomyces candidus]|uniref:SURF1-like protein n=1 Tax=Streptomyces candidus TaxID=67283 RepID=A0A7X0HI45_9ACTN|nr:SURF1 family protein [Streptomyces candidus]MBB6438099.1 cytochrome oxidase assembly protein ShyY1 [Streptomyces candidus]GHH39293.1 SURF1-like protein [Streptomyces candidus]